MFGASVFVTAQTRSVTLHFLLLHVYFRNNEPGGPNGVTIIARLPGSNCQRRLAAKLQFSMHFTFIIHPFYAVCKKLSEDSDSDTILFCFVVGFVYLHGKAVVHMMTELETWRQRGRRILTTWRADSRLRLVAAMAAYCAAGFLMSAASLGNTAQPLAMGLICAVTGWRAPVVALGSFLGYRVFWGDAGMQGIVWAALGCAAALLLGKRRMVTEAPLLLPALGAFLVAATGLVFQVAWGDTTPVSVYLLRVALAALSAGLFAQVVQRKDTLFDWIGEALAVLALAQVVPIPYLGLGFLAGGLIAAGDAFPGAVLAGLALDLAQVTPTPMTAALALSYLPRLIPGGRRWLRYTGPVLAYLLVMGLCGSVDLAPVPGLAVGGALAVLLPPRPQERHRRGETGQAQVRLEIMAGVLSQTQQLLLETGEPPIDEEVLLHRTRERACGGCPNRKQCRDVEIPRELLHAPLTDIGSAPTGCRKPGRLLLELRRSQEQLRFLKGDRQRRREYREAVSQQYRFLGEYLRQTADGLPRRSRPLQPRFTPEVAVCSAGKEAASGDRCLWFAGTEQRYYVLLCDGMGTGIGAAQEGQTAADLLRQMLSAGFPAEYALRSLNSLTALRGRAGAVTVDLAEIALTTGAVAVYKWGAAPSWVLRRQGAEKIGTAGPPPGISVTEIRETVDRLSLRRGEALILSSDGLDAEGVLRTGEISPEAPPGELAACLLERGGGRGGDDATCAVVRLMPAALST